ncbi:MAG TPA: protein kinase, partial [Vicinamibacterales bacterium]
MLTPGSRLGPYDVVGQIGAGGMGEVYQATDSRLKRFVAIKILPPPFAADAERLARFRREAEVLAALNHPNIAAIYGLEETENGVALVMEFVDGPTLADRIRQRSLPADDALRIARQIADALEAAHDIGIVHRDLKPANVKVRPDGTVKVLDFGLAKALEPPVPANTAVSMSPTITTPAMTQAGMILGTAAYMSPEQARGRAIDRRTDIWSFGCVLFEMLSGRRAFEGEDVTDTLAAIVKDTPDWSALPPLPAMVGLFLRQSLEKDPRKRLGDIRDMRLALAGDLALAPEGVPRRKTSLVAAAALVSATLAIAAGVAAVMWPRGIAAPPAVTRFEHPVPDLPTLSRRLITISPDGRRLVYQTRAALFIRTMDEVDARELVSLRTSGTVGDMVLSPDGQWLAYVAGTQLNKVPVSGGAPVPLASVGRTFGASWTADGAILYGHQQGILRLPENGGSPEVVVRANAGEQMHLPQLLPGGESVLFTVTKDGGINRWLRAEVVVQSLRTGQRTVLVSDATDGRYLRTGHLVFARGAGLFGSAFDVRKVALTGSTVSLLQDVQLPVGIFSAGVNFDVSNEGTLVFVKRSSSPRSLVWLNRRTASIEPIKTVPPGEYDDPRLSPDGGRVVMRRDGDLWIYELASGRSNRLTSDAASMMPVWDPAGNRIAYSSGASGNLEAWLTAADGSQPPRALTKMGATVHVDSWSPNGRLLTFHFHGAPAVSGMYTLPMDRENAAPERFAATDPGDEGADFSPDGSHVAFLSSSGGRREIFVRPYPGPGGQAPVSVNGGVEPTWAPNGDVFYRNDEGDRLFVVSTVTQPSLKVGQSVLLLNRPFYVAPTGSPRPQYDVSPDGQRLLMLSNVADAASAPGPRIVVVQNWFGE